MFAALIALASNRLRRSSALTSESASASGEQEVHSVPCLVDVHLLAKITRVELLRSGGPARACVRREIGEDYRLHEQGLRLQSRQQARSDLAKLGDHRHVPPSLFLVTHDHAQERAPLAIDAAWMARVP